MAMLGNIKDFCRQGRIEWTAHVQQRIVQRGISRQDVKDALMSGEIIEDYPDDCPFPSCLMLGANRLHVVCGVSTEALWVITAYRPMEDQWETDLKTRKGRGK